MEGIIRSCCYIQEMFGEFVGPFQPELKTPSYHKSFNMQNLGLEAASDTEKSIIIRALIIVPCWKSFYGVKVML